MGDARVLVYPQLTLVTDQWIQCFHPVIVTFCCYDKIPQPRQFIEEVFTRVYGFRG